MKLPLMDYRANTAPEKPGTALADHIKRHGPMVKRTACRITRDEHLAEDVSQAVFLTLARKGLDQQIHCLGAWLHGVAVRIARTLVRSEMRRKNREAAVSLRPSFHQEPSPGLPPEIDEAIENLPAKYRRVIVGHYLNGQPYEEIAVAEGITAEAVKKRRSEGLERLRRILEPAGCWSAVTLAGLLAREGAAAGGLTAAEVTAIQAAVAGMASAQVVGCAQATIAALFWKKVQAGATYLVASLVLLGGATTTGIWLLPDRSPASEKRTEVEQPDTIFSPVPYFGNAANWVPHTPSRWQVIQENGNPRYFLEGKPSAAVAARTPESATLEYSLTNRTYGDFQLNLKAKTIGISPDSAEFVICFGFRDIKDTFLLVMATDRNQRRNRLGTVLLGVGAAKMKPGTKGSWSRLATATRPGNPDAVRWHQVSVMREKQTLTVAVDGRQVLSATEPQLGQVGQIGLGSWEDSVFFDDISIE